MTKPMSPAELRSRGAASAVEWAEDALVRVHWVRRALRFLGPPRLTELYLASSRWADDPWSLLHDLFPQHRLRLDDVRTEFSAASARLDDRVTSVGRRYPDYYAVERGSQAFLYALVRLLKPARIVEIGVADGASTELLLEALRTNGGGELLSVDLTADVGSLVTDRSAWRLEVVPDGLARHDVERIVRTFGPPELVFHDADHRYVRQRREVEWWFEQLRPGGYLLCDDADYSYGFLAAAARAKVDSAYLMDRRKVMGILGPAEG